MTNFDRDLFLEWGRAFVSAAIAFVLLLLACAMCGCGTTQYVPVPEYHSEAIRGDTAIYNAILRTFRESVRSREQSHDTVIFMRNERVTVNEHGDTIGHDTDTRTYKSTSRERELEKENEMLRDSLGVLSARQSVERVDSVRVPYPVERELTRWERVKMDFGGAAIWGLGGALIAVGILAWMGRKRRR